MAKRTAKLVIGVTGHRNIDEKSPALRKAVAAALKAVANEFGPREVIILSPLAEGADRLVAREAMAVLNARLVVPLPVPQENYEMDFTKTVPAFRKLLKKADSVITAPVPKRSLAWKQYSPQRNRQYALVGAYVAEHSHVLIAIWDRKPARGAGGTAHVVRWFKKGLEQEKAASVPSKYSTAATPGLVLAKASHLVILDPVG